MERRPTRLLKANKKYFFSAPDSGAEFLLLAICRKLCYTKVTEHIGNSFVIFGYNGRDGVVTDKNGLIYMRARYYSPVMKRFVNADILHGTISDSTSLNRYSYVNGNPVSFVDPFGLAGDDKTKTSGDAIWLQYDDAAVYAGHTGLLLQDAEGFWHLFYWGTNDSLIASFGSNVDLFDKNKALQKFSKYDFDTDNLLYNVQQYLYYVKGNTSLSEGLTGVIYFEGDFQNSIEYIKEIIDSKKYNLYSYNCMQASVDALSKGNFDNCDGEYKSAIPYLSSLVIPDEAYYVMLEIDKSINENTGKSWFGKSYSSSSYLVHSLR